MDTVTYPTVGAVAIAAAIVAVIALTLTMIVAIRQSKLLSRYRLILSGPTGHNLEEILVSAHEDISQLQQQLASTTQQLSFLGESTKLHIQRTATVRFNAFPDTGSDLSFAIALLDAHNNGLVISSLYGRSESRVYAKPIVNGASTYSLSDEEKEALARATRANNSNY